MKPEQVRCLRVCGMHMSIPEFAEAIGRSYQMVFTYENGKTGLRAILHQLAKMAKESGWNPANCTGVCT